MCRQPDNQYKRALFTFRDCVTVTVPVAGRQSQINSHGENEERYSHTVTVAFRRLYGCTSLPASKCGDLGIHIQYQPAANIKRNKYLIVVSSEPSYTDASTVLFHSRVPSTHYSFRTKAMLLFWTRTTPSEQSLSILETARHLYSTTMNGYGLRLKHLSMYLSVYT